MASDLDMVDSAMNSMEEVLDSVDKELEEMMKDKEINAELKLEKENEIDKKMEKEESISEDIEAAHGSEFPTMDTLHKESQEQSPYSDGDVVWVKWNLCWWPAEVKHHKNVPESVLCDYSEEEKKLPLVFVKFFDEELYEYVHETSNICPYDCQRKSEFLKKGITKFRSKMKEGSKLMKKFPRDVQTAQIRTGGHPNILSAQEFSPQKPNIDYKEIFGDPNERKKKKLLELAKGKGRGRKSGPPNGMDCSLGKPPITHPRFIYRSDHQVYIRQQVPAQPSTSLEEIPPTSPSTYKCPMCDFTASRLNVIVLHNKSHTPNFKSPNSRMNFSSPSVALTKGRGKHRGKNKSNLNRVPSTDEYMPKPGKRKAIAILTSTAPMKRSKIKTVNRKKKQEDPEICNKLLADWDDDSEEEQGELSEKLLNKEEDESTCSSEIEAPQITSKSEKPEDLNQAFEALFASTASPPSTMPELTPEVSFKKTDVDNTKLPDKGIKKTVEIPSGTNDIDKDDGLEMVVTGTKSQSTPKPLIPRTTWKSNSIKAEKTQSDSFYQTDTSETAFMLVPVDDETGIPLLVGSDNQDDGVAPGQMLYIDSSTLPTDELGNLLLYDGISTADGISLVQLNNTASTSNTNNQQDILAAALANTEVIPKATSKTSDHVCSEIVKMEQPEASISTKIVYASPTSLQEHSLNADHVNEYEQHTLLS